MQPALLTGNPRCVREMATQELDGKGWGHDRNTVGSHSLGFEEANRAEDAAARRSKAWRASNVPKTISRKRRNKAGAGWRNLTMAMRGRVKALKALSPSHETACSGISTRQPEPGRIPNIFSLLCQVHVTLNLWAQKEFSGYRETAAIHHISPPLTDWESIIIKHPSALAITVNHLEGESIHTGPLHTSLVLSLESEPPDANDSYSRIGVRDSPARFGIPVEIHINMEFIQQLVPVTANDETSA